MWKIVITFYKKSTRIYKLVKKAIAANVRVFVGIVVLERHLDIGVLFPELDDKLSCVTILFQIEVTVGAVRVTGEVSNGHPELVHFLDVHLHPAVAGIFEEGKRLGLFLGRNFSFHWNYLSTLL
jgi:hypothetical protein